MFLNTRTEQEIKKYKHLLGVIGSLSNLFADSSIPYISYRVTENLFCKAFSAKNLSRSDVSADASISEIGLGIKTFIDTNGKSMQKIAEFNKDRKIYANKNATDTIKIISELRNIRLDVTKRIHGLNTLLYHCVVRRTGIIVVYETQMDFISTSKISAIVKRDNIIGFTDGINEYSFNVSKSTLYKRFNTPISFIEIPVKIIKDPFDALNNLLGETLDKLQFTTTQQQERIFLPLYSDKEKLVPIKSQLNQWNAGGRLRNFDEVYIPIPAWIHTKFPAFFPPRDVSFELELPNGQIMSTKVCQEGSKALMSNPNKALGQWLLRDVLNLDEGEILTYEKLLTVGLDSVVITKIGTGKYSINFTKIGSFDDFKKEHIK